MREGAHYIQSECERFCCGALKLAFLGEGKPAYQSSLGLDAQVVVGYDMSSSLSAASDSSSILNGGNELISTTTRQDGGVDDQSNMPESVSDALELASPMESYFSTRLVSSYFEVWDYRGGARFLGFVADRHGERCMVVFFDKRAFGHDLKAGYVYTIFVSLLFRSVFGTRWFDHANKHYALRMMELLELCHTPEFDCSEVIICLDRSLLQGESRGVVRDFGWVGFKPTTLSDWTDAGEIVSDCWFFLSMKV